MRKGFKEALKKLTLGCAQQTPGCSWQEEEQVEVCAWILPDVLHPWTLSCCTYDIPPDAWTSTVLSLSVRKTELCLNLGCVYILISILWAECVITFLFSSNASLAWVALIAWYAFLFLRRFSGTNLIIFFVLKKTDVERVRESSARTDIHCTQLELTPNPCAGKKVMI